MGRPLRDLTGLAFGRLTVVCRSGMAYPVRWLCSCSCGLQATPLGHHLVSGAVDSCGCAKGERISARHTRHGESRNPTPEHDAWRDMRARCNSRKHRAYKDYGERGITVCPRWTSYENFLKDMGRRPSPQHSLERKNNELGYSKANCTWATRVEQQNNTRRNRLLTYQGKTQGVAAWARELGLHPATLSSRLRHGWALPRALKPDIED